MHLKSLYIDKFRGLAQFSVEKLGRVNLIVGPNNIGKSSVLEALRIYAGNANLFLLKNIAKEHDEKSNLEDLDLADPNPILPFEAFFTGRRFPKTQEERIVIGESLDSENVMTIAFEKKSINDRNAQKFEDIKINIGNINTGISFDYSNFGIYTPYPADIEKIWPCGFVPTQPIASNELSNTWDQLVLTDATTSVRNALKIIAPDFIDLAFVTELSVPNSKSGNRRYCKVRLASSPIPVPLNSLGDGMSRILQLVLQAHAAKDGFLLIDEFENGLYYGVQDQVWALLFDLAELLNIQIFATTHSRDCVESFARVAVAKTESEGVLISMGQSAQTSNKGQIVAYSLAEAEVQAMLQMGMELR